MPLLIINYLSLNIQTQECVATDSEMITEIVRLAIFTRRTVIWIRDNPATYRDYLGGKESFKQLLPQNYTYQPLSTKYSNAKFRNQG